MCKESIQLEIIKKSEITKKKMRPPALFCIEIRTRKIRFFNLALARKLNLYICNYL